MEARLEQKITAYSKLAAQISSSSSPRASSDNLNEAEEGVGGYKLMEEDIEELLEKVNHMEHRYGSAMLIAHSAWYGLDCAS